MAYRLKYNKYLYRYLLEMILKVLIIKRPSSFCTLYNYSLAEILKYIL